MAAVAEKEKELYPEGLPEEIVLWYLEIVRRLHHVVPPETSEAFVRWRDSRGAQVHEEYGSKYTDNLLIKDPVDKDAAIFLAENRAQGYYLKARLAIEGNSFISLIGPHPFLYYLLAQLGTGVRHLASSWIGTLGKRAGSPILETCPLRMWTQQPKTLCRSSPCLSQNMNGYCSCK